MCLFNFFGIVPIKIHVLFGVKFVFQVEETPSEVVGDTLEEGELEAIETVEECKEVEEEEEEEVLPPELPVEEEQEESGSSGGVGTQASNKVLLDAFISALPNCINRDLIDSAAMEFCLRLNTKPSRKKLVR